MRTSLDEEPTKIIEEKEEQLQLVAQPRPTPTIKQFSNLDTIGFEIERESLSEEKVDVLAEKRREEILKVKEVSAEEEQRRDAQRQKLGNINNAKLLPGSHFPPPLPPPCFKDLSYDTINSYKPMPLLPNLPYPFPTYRFFPLPNGFINGKSLPEAQFGQNFQWRK